MSERNTRLTENLITEEYRKVFEGNSTDRWMQKQRVIALAKELADKELVDEHALREVAMYNAGKHNLDVEAADRVLDVRQKAAGGSLAAMHAPSRPVWQGTGTSISAVGPEIVHYINKPGIIESSEFGGPGLSFILDQLCISGIALSIKGYKSINNTGGYDYVTNRQHSLGISGLPHIGGAVVDRESVFYPRPGTPDFVISSSSGTLVADWVDETYQRIPGYAERAITDEAAGLFAGHPEYKRLGLYDKMHAEMTATALLGGRLDDQMLRVFDPGFYVGVDIN